MTLHNTVPKMLNAKVARMFEMIRVPQAMKHLRYSGQSFKCEKCGEQFRSYGQFRLHKWEDHSY